MKTGYDPKVGGARLDHTGRMLRFRPFYRSASDSPPVKPHVLAH